ncbi:hypothetical protein CDD81_7668 [Ophiocordyceps australis]|uniref:Velvet domain-containing protein n=1 Tax=Ophiocordyceps australis TaxID=1399860 RepID=A0A2C5XZW2_9HYPO|nr:hypothetical protein CDD81_7668 [Ophiocordyceps australis]
MATPSCIPVNCSRDTVRHIHRTTRENRSLWYQLTVLQQPERARACGSGMKANSDRRPVDPPPVVELRIIEGPSLDEGKDITFDYNANFFLYASLEQARSLTHGRVQTPAASNPPILTGVPASGMAYLDRPAEAGYFIFPDLSVRHEGYFRLSFSLFETTKEERDFDPTPADNDLPPGVDWRMEIKTQPFNVYSAKKFPGLMESTQLSKTVADQGCRVRIRRDVRMRKRDSKGNGYDRRDEGFSRRQAVTPASEDAHGIRGRSLSTANDHALPYVGDGHRKSSAADSYHLDPPPPTYENASRSHLSFGDGPAPSHYVAAPVPRQCSNQATVAAPPISPSGPYPTSLSSYGYSHGHRDSNSTCPSPLVPLKQEPIDRDAGPACISRSPTIVPEGHGRRESHVTLIPGTPILPAPTPSPQRQHFAQSNTSLAPLKISSLMSPPLPPIEAQPILPAPPAAPFAGKRKHDSVFTQNMQPLHNGRRQLDPHLNGRRPDLGDGLYTRADGNYGVINFSAFS